MITSKNNIDLINIIYYTKIIKSILNNHVVNYKKIQNRETISLMIDDALIQKYLLEEFKDRIPWIKFMLSQKLYKTI